MSLIDDAVARIGNLKDRIDLHEKYVAVFGTPTGREVLRHIMRVGHCASSTFVQGDPGATSFREGQRHLALSIARMVFRDTTKLIKQIEEGLEHEA